jgi:hypothetical protein
MTPSNLPIRERTRLVNVFPLTLGPHGSDLRDVLGSLKGSKELESGVIMQIPYGESEVLVEAQYSHWLSGISEICPSKPNAQASYVKTLHLGAEVVQYLQRNMVIWPMMSP